MAVTLTEKAAQEVKSLFERKGKPNAMLRLFVQGGGCSGFQYGLAIEEEIEEGDQVFTSDGVKVVVDPISLQYVDGSVIDYTETLMGAGFAVHNPLAVKTCGCGHSFQTKESQGSGGGCCH